MQIHVCNTRLSYTYTHIIIRDSTTRNTKGHRKKREKCIMTLHKILDHVNIKQLSMPTWGVYTTFVTKYVYDVTMYRF